MNPRIQRVRHALKENGLDSFLVTNDTNISYLIDFPITDSCLLLTRTKNIILTDFRYMAEAKNLRNFILKKVNSSIVDEIVSLIKDLKLRRIGFEGKDLFYNFYIEIKKRLKRPVLISTTNLIENLRMVKDNRELEIIWEAIKISKATFSYIKRILKEGMSEKDLAKKIDVYIRSHGGEGVAFPTIVASGSNSAKPHAPITNRRIRRNEPVIIDLGVRLFGYNSDLTRTFWLGKMKPKFYEIYNVIKVAQKRAISYIKPGRFISEVDRAARNFIAKAGFSEQFGHALGHGIGREVHESPKICKTTKKGLLPNMVFTIEPAVYIPGWGGIRIEDMVLVTQKGFKVLSNDIDKSI